jgi:hypothetical protein
VKVEGLRIGQIYGGTYPDIIVLGRCSDPKKERNNDGREVHGEV